MLTRPPACLLAITLSVCLGSAPASASPEADGAETVPAPEVLASIGSWLTDLEERKARMEARWGYTGSRETVTAAFQEAGITGSPLQRASAWAKRLYVVWGKVKPWYDDHAAALDRIAVLVRAQGGAPGYDVAWLEARHDRLRRRAEMLEEGMEILLDLRVQRAQAAVALAAYEAQRARGGSALAQLGGGSGGSRQEVRNRAAAIAASESSLADALVADAEEVVIPELEPVGTRTEHRVGALALVGGETEEVGAGAAGVPSDGAGQLAGLMIGAARAADAVERAGATAERLASEAEAADTRAAEVRTLLETVERSADLPGVREATARERELEARIESLRAQVKAVDLEAPGGQERARKLAGEILELRKELPPIREELARLRSDRNLAAWREARQRERTEALATASDARRRGIRALAVRGAAARSLVLARAERRVLELDALLEGVTTLEQAIRRQPQLAAVTLTAGGRLAFSAERIGAERLADLRTDLEADRERLGLLAALVRELGPRVVDSAREAALATLDRGDEAPPATRRDALEDTLRRLGVDGVVGDLIAVKGKSVAAAYARLSREVPEPMALLEAHAAPDAAEVLARYSGEETGEPTRTSSSAEVLRTFAGRLDDLSLRAAVDAVRAPDAPRAEAIVRPYLTALVTQPLAREADRALAHLTWLVGQNLAEHNRELAAHSETHGFAVEPGAPFVAGMPLEAHITLTAPDAPAPTELRLGDAVLEPTDADSSGATRRYHHPRTPALPDGAPLTLELVAP